MSIVNSLIGSHYWCVVVIPDTRFDDVSQKNGSILELLICVLTEATVSCAFDLKTLLRAIYGDKVS